MVGRHGALLPVPTRNSEGNVVVARHYGGGRRFAGGSGIGRPLQLLHVQGSERTGPDKLVVRFWFRLRNRRGCPGGQLAARSQVGAGAPSRGDRLGESWKCQERQLLPIGRLAGSEKLAAALALAVGCWPVSPALNRASR